MILSWILSFYLPSFNQELRTFKQLKSENNEWQLFYQLADIQLSDLDSIKKETLIQSTMESYQLLFSVEVDDFSCDTNSCQIEFKRGSAYQIEIQAIQTL
ncbi:hypothetical protein ACQV2G_03700 [Facklamia sp. P12955]|uniref:hypothetical protein n=1 Tax=Facklamia sp. P12934 TaxID=3421948 RepID=UPI003D169414